MRGFNRMAILAITASMALVACDESGVNGPDTDEANFTILIQPERTTAAGMAALLAPEDPSAARISLDVVESIVLPIGAVEAKQTGEGPWVDAGDINADVDLLALPEEGITLLDSSLPQGSYQALRFFLTDQATITLSEDVSVGRTVYEAGTHPLVIPSSEQNGVRLRTEFEVDADGQVLTVLFDGDATVRRVTATGSGTLKIAPQLRVENEEGDDVGETDDDEDDEEDEEEVEVEGVVASVTDTGFTLEDGTVVVLRDDTEIDGDLLSLAAVAEALENGEVVLAEVEGTFDEDGSTVIADEVNFELEDDSELEVEGVVTAVNRPARTFTVEGAEETITVVMRDDTQVDDDSDFESFDAMADAFDGGATIEAEAEGQRVGNSSRLSADEVKFEEDDEEVEVEGLVTGVDRSATTFVIDAGDGRSVTVVMTDETEVDDDGDFDSFEAMADAFEGGASIRAEAEGVLEGEDRLVASEVEFEEELVEVEGLVTGVDRSATTFVVDVGDGRSVTVVMTDETEVDDGGDFESFEAMADAFEGGASIRAEAEGVLEEDRLVASEVEFEEEDDE